MSPQEYQTLLGAILAIALTLGPWMFMVHAKLAVLAARIVDLAAAVDKASDANRELWKLSAQHATRLETHDVQFAHVAERLEELS